MKKSFLLFALLAGIAVMTGCKKDQDVVTLQAVVDQDTKAYFGNSDRTLPYWDAGDEVNVNGTDKPLTFPGNTITTIATIACVDASEYYCAIYPASVVEKMGNPGATTTATIYFDPNQQYIWENNRQRVNMPMGAVTSNDDKTLIFKNLCSILRLKVKNTLATDFLVKKLTVTSFGGYIAGHFDVTLSASGNPVINASSLNSTGEDNTLTVYVPNKEIPRTTDSEHPIFVDFDIVVPPFNAEYLILEAELLNTDGSLFGYTSDTVAMASATFTPGPGHSITDEGATTGPVSVPVNKIVTLQFGVNHLNDVITYDYGYLEPGPDFNSDISTLIGTRTDVKQIMFINGATNAQPLINAGLIDEHGNSLDRTISGWTDVSTSDSPHKIYAHIEDDPDGSSILKIYSWADFIYANTNCNNMFRDLTTIEGIQWTTSRDRGFQSEDVNSMAYMFAGCTHLKTLVSPNNGVDDGKFYLNTTNVTNMEHMFDGCEGLTSLHLVFNTHNVKNMEAMFNYCTKLQALHISSFNMDRVTNKTNMCKDISISYTWQGSCDLTCTESVQTALLEKRYVATNDVTGITYYADTANEDEDPSTLYYYYITGINPNKIY